MRYLDTNTGDIVVTDEAGVVLHRHCVNALHPHTYPTDTPECIDPHIVFEYLHGLYEPHYPVPMLASDAQELYELSDAGAHTIMRYAYDNNLSRVAMYGLLNSREFAPIANAYYTARETQQPE